MIGKNPDPAAERESDASDLALDQDLDTDIEVEVKAELGAEAGKCYLPCTWFCLLGRCVVADGNGLPVNVCSVWLNGFGFFSAVLTVGSRLDGLLGLTETSRQLESLKLLAYHSVTSY